MSKTAGQGKDEVAALVDFFRKNRRAFLSPEVKEAEVRQQLIDPLFIALGWNVRNEDPGRVAPQNREVVLEASLDDEGHRRAPDYAFRIGLTPKFYAEAKKALPLSVWVKFPAPGPRATGRVLRGGSKSPGGIGSCCGIPGCGL